MLKGSRYKEYLMADKFSLLRRLIMNNFSVLMYHDIVSKKVFNYDKNQGIKVKQQYKDKLPKILFNYVEEFEKQMKYLYENNYITLKLQDIVDFYYNGKSIPEKSVLITFDDMYKSAKIYAYPILKKYNFSAVGFLVEDWIFHNEEKNSPEASICMCENELIEISDVFEFANHSKALHTRQEQGTALQLVDEGEFYSDLKSCGEFIKNINKNSFDKKYLHKNLTFAYAYPFGVYNERIIHQLKECGYSLAFTTKPGINYGDTNPLELCRNAVILDWNMESFIKIFS